MDKDTETLTIQQISPAPPGWEAVFAQKDQTIGEKTAIVKLPLACWALVNTREEGTEPYASVVGMVEQGGEYLGLAPQLPGFLGYSYPGNETDWQLQATNALQGASESSHDVI